MPMNFITALSCLDRFREVTKDQAFQLLNDSGDYREVLRRYFERLIDNALSDENGCRGCFIANTAMELGTADPVIAARIREFTNELEEMFVQFLTRAVQQGQLRSQHSVRELARYLLSVRNGLYVLGKSGSDRSMLEDAVKVALSVV